MRKDGHNPGFRFNIQFSTLPWPDYTSQNNTCSVKSSTLLFVALQNRVRMPRKDKHVLVSQPAAQQSIILAC
jgi:hypothetical protein